MGLGFHIAIDYTAWPYQECTVRTLWQLGYYTPTLREILETQYRRTDSPHHNTRVLPRITGNKVAPNAHGRRARGARSPGDCPWPTHAP